MESIRKVCGVTEARPLEDLTLEFYALFSEGAQTLGLLQEGLPGAFPGFLGLVAGKVNKVHRSWPSEEVEGGDEDKERGTNNHGDEVEAEVLPEDMKVSDGECRHVGSDEDEEGKDEEVHAMGDDIVVTKLDILEFDGFREVRELARGFLEQWRVVSWFCRGFSHVYLWIIRAVMRILGGGL